MPRHQTATPQQYIPLTRRQILKQLLGIKLWASDLNANTCYAYLAARAI